MSGQIPHRAEAERLLGVAEKLLQSGDFAGCRDFAVLAQETEPLLDGSDQILAVADVLSSSENRINNHHNWYAVLQIEPGSDDQDLIKQQYRCLALLLHPDKNHYPFADQAFQLVADAWAVLSDSTKKSLYDKELSLFSRVDLSSSGKLPVRRSQRATGKDATEPAQTGDGNQRSRLSSFWTACPYCYILYEYPRVYQECCLRCQNCNRAFHAAVISALPPLVPGQEAYYCCWAFFPLGFVSSEGENGRKNAGATGFPNWMPPIFSPGQQTRGDYMAGTATPPPQPPPTECPLQQQQAGVKTPNVNSGSRPRAPNIATSTVMGLMAMGSRGGGDSGGGGGSGVARGGGSVQVQGSGAKKRGRPRKNPI